MKKIFLTIFVTAAVLVVAFALFVTFACDDDWCYVFPWQKQETTQSFAECVAQGNPVMEIFPRKCRAGGETFVEPTSANPTPAPTPVPVTSLSIQPNQQITSPLSFSGEVLGIWFFEASFPVSVTDANGQPLGTGIAQAQSDWMTTNYVPFTVQVTFTTPTTTTGYIIFEKDNPSGLPQNAASYTIPVLF